MQIASIGGVELAYRTAGDDGDVPVLLIHGYTGNLRNWGATVPPLLRGGFRTLSADNPGHGASGAPQRFEPYALDEVARTLHGLAEGLDFHPAVLVGHSMGGAIAEEYALQFPEAVRALVLVGSAGGASGPEREDLSDDMQALRAACERGGMEAVFDLQLEHGKRPAAAAADPDRQALLRAEFARTSFEGFEFGALALRTRRDTLPRLGKLRLPTLIVRGEHEDPTLVRVSDDLAATLPDARLVVIPGAGHSPQFEAPDAFNRVLLEFLDAL
jgi:2-succinyl-6-hydroxy-2,4-cyclohexadiene-1-carboxylate synthase